jgi:IclR family mhp operon transcriptional activator
VEIASGVLEQLCERVMWPSVLSVPRLDHMEVVETNSPRARFDELPAAPIGFRANLLRSASGRAYLAYCPDQEREAVLRRLAEREVAGHELARDQEAMKLLVETTRRRGYSVRVPDFGGHYSKPRTEVDDGRNSIAMPIRSGGQVLGCVNLTWRRKALSVAQVVSRYGGELHSAVARIESRISELGVMGAEGTGLPADGTAAQPGPAVVAVPAPGSAPGTPAPGSAPGTPVLGSATGTPLPGPA